MTLVFLSTRMLIRVRSCSDQNRMRATLCAPGCSFRKVAAVGQAASLPFHGMSDANGEYERSPHTVGTVSPGSLFARRRKWQAGSLPYGFQPRLRLGRRLVLDDAFAG